MIYRSEINTNTYTICIEWKNPNTRTRLICWNGHTCPTLFPSFLILIPNVVQRIRWTKYDLGINNDFFHGKFGKYFKKHAFKVWNVFRRKTTPLARNQKNRGKFCHLHDNPHLCMHLWDPIMRLYVKDYGGPP